MMRTKPLLAALVLTMVVSACGGSSTPPAAAPSSDAPLTAATAHDRQVAAMAGYTGLTGTIAFSQHEAGGTLTLAGTFTSNFADPAHPTSRLALRRSAPLPADTAEVRGIGTDVYFKAGSERWVHLGRDFPPANSTVAAEQGLAAMLLGGISPTQFSNLLRVNPLGADPATGATGHYRFTGAAKLGYTDNVSTNFKSDVLTDLTKQGVLADDFALTLDARARPVSLRQRFTAATVDIDYLVTITGYTAAPTPIPTA